jgi:hypothetical protein
MAAVILLMMTRHLSQSSYAALMKAVSIVGAMLLSRPRRKGTRKGGNLIGLRRSLSSSERSYLK